MCIRAEGEWGAKTSLGIASVHIRTEGGRLEIGVCANNPFGQQLPRPEARAVALLTNDAPPQEVARWSPVNTSNSIDRTERETDQRGEC